MGARGVRRLAAVAAWGAFWSAVLCAPALAAPTLELATASPEPVESITTQIEAAVKHGAGDELVVKVLPAGGEPCGANPRATVGQDATEGLISNVGLAGGSRRA